MRRFAILQKQSGAQRSSSVLCNVQASDNQNSGPALLSKNVNLKESLFSIKSRVMPKETKDRSPLEEVQPESFSSNKALDRVDLLFEANTAFFPVSDESDAEISNPLNQITWKLHNNSTHNLVVFPSSRPDIDDEDDMTLRPKVPKTSFKSLPSFQFKSNIEKTGIIIPNTARSICTRRLSSRADERVSDLYYPKIEKRPVTERNHHDLAAQSLERPSQSPADVWWPPEKQKGSCSYSRRKVNLVYQDVRGLRGLENLGNTCYINCAVQCLAATRPLAHYFMNNLHMEELNSIETNEDGTGGRLTIELAETIKVLWTSPSQPSTTRHHFPVVNTRGVNPKTLKKEIDRAAPQFSGYDQHDAQELLATLLDKVHEDINRVKGKKPYVQEMDIDSRTLETHLEEVLAAESWERYLRRNRSFLVDVFQGQLRSLTKCRRCSEVSVKYDPFMYLTLPTSSPVTSVPVRTIQEALDAFLAPELLSDSDSWFCPCCRQLCPALKEIVIWKLPPILIIHLKKFQYSNGSFAKLDSRIELKDGPTKPIVFPVGCDQKEEPIYRLYAIINHSGRYQNGHYSALCYHQIARRWFSFDDEVVSEAPDDSLISSSNYLLFFERLGPQNAEDGPLVRRQSLTKPELWPHVLTHRKIFEFRERTKKSGITDTEGIVKRSNATPPGGKKHTSSTHKANDQHIADTSGEDSSQQGTPSPTRDVEMVDLLPRRSTSRSVNRFSCRRPDF